MSSLPGGFPPILKKLANDFGAKLPPLDVALRGDRGGFLGDDRTRLGEFTFSVIENEKPSKRASNQIDLSKIQDLWIKEHIGGKDWM